MMLIDLLWIVIGVELGFFVWYLCRTIPKIRKMKKEIKWLENELDREAPGWRKSI